MTKSNTMTVARQFAVLRMQRRHLADKVMPKVKDATCKAAIKAAVAIFDEEIAKQPPAAVKAPANRNRAAVQAHLTRLQKRVKGTRGKVRLDLVAKIAAFEQRLVAIDAPPASKPVRAPRQRRAVVEQPPVNETEALPAASEATDTINWVL